MCVGGYGWAGTPGRDYCAHFPTPSVTDGTRNVMEALEQSGFGSPLPSQIAHDRGHPIHALGPSRYPYRTLACELSKQTPIFMLGLM